MGAAAGWEAGLLYGGAAAAAAAIAHVESLDRNRGGQAGESTEDEPRTTPQGWPPGKEGNGRSTATAAAIGRVKPGQSRHAGSEDDEQPPIDETSAATTPSESEGLGALVKELKRASLLGPDGPRVDRADVVRRLRLLGPAGVAVAGGLPP